MDEKLKEQLKLLEKYRLRLEEIAAHSREDYLRDGLLQGAAERYLQMSIESCINIGNRIISLAQFDKKIPAPESYADVFRKLGNLIEDMSSQFINNLVSMARFRNRLVHLYWEVEPEEAYDFLKLHIGDFIKFRDYIVSYLKDKFIA